MSETNGKWALGFWIITVFTLIVGGAVIANDRARASEDQRIECKIETVCKDQGKVNQEILIALAEIKTDVRYIKQGMK